MASNLTYPLRIRPMRMEDVDQVVQIDRLSFSLPWPVSAYRYEVEENLRSSKLVAEVPSEVAINPMVSQMSPTMTMIDGNPGSRKYREYSSESPAPKYSSASSAMIEHETIPKNGNDFSIVGMIVIWMIIDEAHIATIAVHPNFRRQGIAKILVTAGLDEATKLMMKTATLEVRAGNLAAQTLYRQFGFESVGIRPRYYKDNANGVTTYEDAIIMTRRLV